MNVGVCMTVKGGDVGVKHNLMNAAKTRFSFVLACCVLAAIASFGCGDDTSSQKTCPSQCPNDCDDKGVCNQHGVTCPELCPNDCDDQGACNQHGVACPSQCPNDCDDQGVCNQPGVTCPEQCPNDCDDQGVCNQHGVTCPEQCPNDCDDQGICIDHDSCEGDAVECVEKDLSIKRCQDGKWETEICPESTPYCRTGAEACSVIEIGDACESSTFVPHISTRGFVVLCPYKVMRYAGTEWSQADAKYLVQGTDTMKAKRGYGVETGDAEACTTKGETRLHDGIDDTLFRYVACQKCKVNEDGELHWLYVPATYELTNSNSEVSCTPWEDVE